MSMAFIKTLKKNKMSNERKCFGAGKVIRRADRTRNMEEKMNDRLKFRGKIKESEWFYGSLGYWCNGPEIWTYDGHNFVVDIESVGQCTGLKDKHGKLIYEGDIVKTKEFGKYIPERKINVADFDIFEIKFIKEYASFGIENKNRRFSCLSSCKTFEIIGNVYENPELLEIL